MYRRSLSPTTLLIELWQGLSHNSGISEPAKSADPSWKYGSVLLWPGIDSSQALQIPIWVIADVQRWKGDC